jgi:hypothetical protein
MEGVVVAMAVPLGSLEPGHRSDYEKFAVVARPGAPVEISALSACWEDGPRAPSSTRARFVCLAGGDAPGEPALALAQRPEDAAAKFELRQSFKLVALGGPAGGACEHMLASLGP